MIDLIARLENSTGKDRELDIAICRATDANGYRIEDDGTILVSGDMGDGPGWFNIGYDIPAFTESIDAALTLVGQLHWQVEVFNLDNIPRAQIAEPTMTKFGPAVGIRAQAKGATPAIALCIAALKARKALKDSEHTK